jgi:hypothetical protein
LRAGEQDRRDISRGRQRGRACQRKIDFLDETGTASDMTHRYGQCAKGQRLVAKAPWGHWKTTISIYDEPMASADDIAAVAAICDEFETNSYGALERPCGRPG